MAETKKRIIQYNEVTTFNNDDYLLLDGATDGTRKILASNVGGSGGGGGVDYSTTEQDTGLKWIDGKPIYQKTIVLANEINISTSGASIPSSNFNGLNIENIINSIAYRLVSDARDGCANVPSVIWFYDGNYNIYTIGTWSGIRTITIYYTKTTDTV